MGKGKKPTVYSGIFSLDCYTFSYLINNIKSLIFVIHP